MFGVFFTRARSWMRDQIPDIKKDKTSKQFSDRETDWYFNHFQKKKELSISDRKSILQSLKAHKREVGDEREAAALQNGTNFARSELNATLYFHNKSVDQKWSRKS